MATQQLIKHIYLFLAFTSVTFSIRAQDTVRKSVTATRTVVSRQPLDTNQLVYDEKGNALHYYQYTRLINTGGYTVKSKVQFSVGADDGKRYLVKIDPKENLRRYEMIKPMLTIKSPNLQEGKELDLSPLLKSFTKEELNKKAIVLLFWYADCPPCTEAFDSINGFLKQVTNPQDVVIIAITKDSQQVAAAKSIEKPLQYAHLLSSAGNITNFYQLRTYPAYVVADKDHIIRYAVSAHRL